MLIGEFRHIIDNKKRVAVPAKWRQEIGPKVVITHGLDECLSVYSLTRWEEVVGKLSSLSLGQSGSRGFNRFMLAGAVEIEVDANGRILVPEFLKEYAGLQTKVVLAGLYGRFEIWEEKRWQIYKEGIKGQLGGLAEKLGDSGVF